MINKESITRILRLGDDSADVTDVQISSDTIEVTLQKKDQVMFCPECGCRMESKGIRVRKVNHPVMQDGYKLILHVKERKWNCRNCNFYTHDRFNFLEDYKQNTSLVPIMIVNEMKDLHVTARQVAVRFNVSDTYVMTTFMQYVNMPRLKFTEAICVDEVHMVYDRRDLYSLVIMDFKSGQVIDMLPNRYESTSQEYFLNIPREERAGVKYLICDMYKPYINYVQRYFYNAIAIVDSFHVIQLIINRIRQYIRMVMKKYQELDRKELKEKNYRNNASHKTMRESREVTYLRRYDYFLLKNHDDIDFTAGWRTSKRGNEYYFDPYVYEKNFLGLDKNFSKIRDLKELYVQFNKRHVNDPEGASEDLNKIIDTYQNSDLSMFREIAVTLKTYHDNIVNSFTYISGADRKNSNEMMTRLSNGPMEGFNVLPKDLKRQSRGVSNFEYTRNRILWATREQKPMLAIPRSREDVHTSTGKKRGPYSKQSGKQDTSLDK